MRDLSARPLSFSRRPSRNHTGWVMGDDERLLPQPHAHLLRVALLVDILREHVKRRGIHAQIGSDIAVRCDARHPRRAIDPDVYWVEPPPPNGIRDPCLKLWRRGFRPPRIVVEMVFAQTAKRDYIDKPAVYRNMGVRELWMFDPDLHGPPRRRCVLQVWRRDRPHGFRQVYSGDGPARSQELGAWLVVTDHGTQLRVADNADGTGLWPTTVEAIRAESALPRSPDDLAHMSIERLNTEIERLRAELSRRGG